MNSGKVDVGAARNADSYHRTVGKPPSGRSFDNYGRSGLCANSLYNIYPGSADCHMCGLIDTETTLRPAYYNSIGGNCDAGYPDILNGNVLHGNVGGASCGDNTVCLGASIRDNMTVNGLALNM
jgi:hypothetical protein